MRDEYNRITPDFDAWEKLGYVYTECHSETYILTKKEDVDCYYDFTEIICEYETATNDSGIPEYYKQRQIFPDTARELEFTEAEQEQIKKDINNWKEETNK